jgi:hypothetical protein
MADIQKLFDLADPRIRKIWDEKDTQLSKRLDYSDLGLSDYTAEILDTQFENFTGLGIAQQTGEMEPYKREDIAAAKKVTITPVKFTKAITITEEMLRFNLWPKINNLVGAVANSLNARINTDVAKVFYLGFGTTFITGGDGQPLFSSVHPMGDGTTQSNTLGALPLNYDNLKLGAQMMDRFYDDKGIQLLPSMKLRLIVARENKERAEEVLRSIGNPDNANRINNYFLSNGGYIDYKVANWIPSAYGKNWFLVDMERASNMAYLVWGWRPKFDDDKVVNNGTKIYTGSTMFRPGFQSWQWCVGANATT